MCTDYPCLVANRPKPKALIKLKRMVVIFFVDVEYSVRGVLEFC